MRNHEVVPAQLVAGVAGLPHGHCHKILRELCRYKLIHFEHKKSELRMSERALVALLFVNWCIGLDGSSEKNGPAFMA